jgi:hypothetical protein
MRYSLNRIAIAILLLIPSLAFAQSPNFDSLTLNAPLPIPSGGSGAKTSLAASALVQVQAASASAARLLTSKLGDQLSLLDFGAACDGTTDDSAAVIAAGSSGRRVIVPDGVVCNAPAVVQGAMAGTFLGGGKVKGSDGNTRGPRFAAVLSPPNLASWDSGNSVPLGCTGGQGCWGNWDYSHELTAEEFHISGAATLGQPAHGYQNMPGTSAHTIYATNNSGYNAAAANQDGRTGAYVNSFHIQQNGGGDFGLWTGSIFCGGTSKPAAGGQYTDWLAVPGCGLLGVNISALDGAEHQLPQYLQSTEIHFSDGPAGVGHDVSMIGNVYGYERNWPGPATLNNRVVHEIVSCNGAHTTVGLPCDAAFQIGGAWRTSLNFVGAGNGTSNMTPIAMMAGQRVSFNGTPNDPTGENNPALTVLGTDFITDDALGIVISQNGGTVLRLTNPTAGTPPVDYLEAHGAPTGAPYVGLTAKGSDAVISLTLTDKGGGGIVLQSGSGANVFRAVAATNANSYLNLTAGTASTSMQLADFFSGDQDFALAAAGTGLLRDGGTQPTAADSSSALATTASVQGAITLAAAGGVSCAAGSVSLATLVVTAGRVTHC